MIRYVIDKRRIAGGCLTKMSDGTHCDYSGKTLEQLRSDYPAAELAVVDRRTLMRRQRAFDRALQTPFERISQEAFVRAFERMPPERTGRDWFFLGERYHGTLAYLFARTEHACYRSVRDTRLADSKIAAMVQALQQQEHEHPVITHGKEILDPLPTMQPRMNFIPVFFVSGGRRHFINMLAVRSGSEQQDREARTRMASQIASLRYHDFRYMTLAGETNLFDFLRSAALNDYTLMPISRGRLLHVVKRIFVDFSGDVKDVGARFYYRIYDSDTLEALLHTLKIVYIQKP